MPTRRAKCNEPTLLHITQLFDYKTQYANCDSTCLEGSDGVKIAEGLQRLVGRAATVQRRRRGVSSIVERAAQSTHPPCSARFRWHRNLRPCEMGCAVPGAAPTRGSSPTTISVALPSRRCHTLRHHSRSCGLCSHHSASPVRATCPRAASPATSRAWRPRASTTTPQPSSRRQA